jgi:hypothetical protein
MAVTTQLDPLRQLEVFKTCSTSEPEELRRCRNGTFWFQPQSAKNGKECHSELPSAQNKTTDFLTDATVIVVSSTFHKTFIITHKT